MLTPTVLLLFLILWKVSSMKDAQDAERGRQYRQRMGYPPPGPAPKPPAVPVEVATKPRKESDIERAARLGGWV